MSKAEQEASGTQTASGSSAANSAGETDAELVQDVPPRTASAAPRTVKLDVGGVFDAEVNDAKGAKKGPRPEGGEAPKGKKKKEGAAPEAPPPEPTDAHLAKARNYTRMLEGMHRAGLKARYQKLLTTESAAELDEAMKLTPEQLDVIALPMAQGLAIHGGLLPWWAELGFGAIGMGIIRAGICDGLEKEYKRRAAAAGGEK